MCERERERERERVRERGVGLCVGEFAEKWLYWLLMLSIFLFCLFASCTGTIKENRIGKIKRFASLGFFFLHIFGIGQLILSFFALTCNF